MEEEDFDDLLEQLEKNLNENDELIYSIKTKLKGDFLKLVEQY